MLKLLIGGAIGFGVGWVIFKRPQDQAVEAVRQTWTEMARAIPRGDMWTPPQVSPTPNQPVLRTDNEPTPKLQGFGYSRTRRWN